MPTDKAAAASVSRAWTGTPSSTGGWGGSRPAAHAIASHAEAAQIKAGPSEEVEVGQGGQP